MAAPLKTFVVVWRFANWGEDIFFYRARTKVPEDVILRKIARTHKEDRDVYILQHCEVPTDPLPFKELWK